jgi:hypothetical protein
VARPSGARAHSAAKSHGRLATTPYYSCSSIDSEYSYPYSVLKYTLITVCTQLCTHSSLYACVHTQLRAGVRCRCKAVQLYSCTAVLNLVRCRCKAVQLYSCTAVQLYSCKAVYTGIVLQ